MAQGGDADGEQLHGGPVFYRAGVYFSLLQVLDLGGIGTMPGDLALSRDGVNWTRPFRHQYFLPVSGDGKTFDSGCLWTNAMPIMLEDEMRFYYGAYSAWNSDINNDPSGIGLSVLPKDRFAGIRPIDRIGQITLKPCSFQGVDKISLNADATDGRIWPELLTADGYRVRGFTKDDARVIIGDDLEHRLAWKNTTMRKLPPGDYRLRLHLENAEVFAIETLRP